MKKILFTLFITNLLIARENPFVPTKTFINEKQAILENLQKTKTITKDNINIDKTEENNIINNTNQNLLIESKQIKTTINNNIIQKNNNNTNNKFNKVEINDTLIKEFYPFSFLRIQEYKNSIVISSTYEIIKKFMIHNPHRIAIDFSAKVNQKLSTIKLNSLFYKMIFGNHRREGFFRIVLYSKEDPRKYKRTYSKKDIIIMKK